MKTDYDTVPGFAARRGWHANNLNSHNYGAKLEADNAVFPTNFLSQGPMAQMLARPTSPTHPSSQMPRGRARSGTDYYGTNLLETQGANPFDSKFVGQTFSK